MSQCFALTVICNHLVARTGIKQCLDLNRLEFLGSGFLGLTRVAFEVEPNYREKMSLKPKQTVLLVNNRHINKKTICSTVQVARWNT